MHLRHSRFLSHTSSSLTPLLVLMLSWFSDQLLPGVPGEKNIDLKTSIIETADFWKTPAFSGNSPLILENLNVKQFRRISEDEKCLRQHPLFKTLTVNTKCKENTRILRHLNSAISSLPHSCREKPYARRSRYPYMAVQPELGALCNMAGAVWSSVKLYGPLHSCLYLLCLQSTSTTLTITGIVFEIWIWVLWKLDWDQ